MPSLRCSFLVEKRMRSNFTKPWFFEWKFEIVLHRIAHKYSGNETINISKSQSETNLPMWNAKKCRSFFFVSVLSFFISSYFPANAIKLRTAHGAFYEQSRSIRLGISRIITRDRSLSPMTLMDQRDSRKARAILHIFHSRTILYGSLSNPSFIEQEKEKQGKVKISALYITSSFTNEKKKRLVHYHKR